MAVMGGSGGSMGGGDGGGDVGGGGVGGGGGLGGTEPVTTRKSPNVLQLLSSW